MQLRWRTARLSEPKQDAGSHPPHTSKPASAKGHQYALGPSRPGDPNAPGAAFWRSGH